MKTDVATESCVEIESSGPEAQISEGILALRSPRGDIGYAGKITARQEFIAFANLRILTIDRQLLLLGAPSSVGIVSEGFVKPKRSGQEDPHALIKMEIARLNAIKSALSDDRIIGAPHLTQDERRSTITSALADIWEPAFKWKDYSVFEKAVSDDVGTTLGRIDETAREMAIQLSRHYVPLVRFSINKAGIPQRHPQRDDLEQSGYLKLLDLIVRFEPEQGFRFTTYAVLSLKRYSEHEITKTTQGAQSRLDSSEMALYERIIQESSKRHPNIFDCMRAGLSPKAATDLLRKVSRSRVGRVSQISDQVRHPDQVHREEAAWDPVDSTSLEHNAASLPDAPSADELGVIVARALDTLNPRRRQLVEWHFGLDGGQGGTIRDMASRLGISHTAVSNDLIKALAHLAINPDFRALARRMHL